MRLEFSERAYQDNQQVLNRKDDLPEIGEKNIIVVHGEEGLLDNHLAQLAGIDGSVLCQDERTNRDLFGDPLLGAMGEELLNVHDAYNALGRTGPRKFTVRIWQVVVDWSRRSCTVWCNVVGHCR